MRAFFSKQKATVVLAVVVIALITLGTFGFHKKTQPIEVVVPIIATPTPPVVEDHVKVIGRSVEGRSIEAYTFGTGTKKLLFVGGMHGGYEYNSVLLAYQFMDYLGADPSNIPSGLRVVVIPSINPDGVYDVVGKVGRFTLLDIPTTTQKLGYGRFNAHGVDLNRNFACNWKSKSMWQGNVVSAGAAPFSEPEAAALRDYVLAESPTAVIFWHSKSNAVYASECNDGILPDTLAIMSAYAKASGYTAVKAFTAYKVTGDAEGWLASIGIPAITVELKTHETVEWAQNLAGAKALFTHYQSGDNIKK